MRRHLALSIAAAALLVIGGACSSGPDLAEPPASTDPPPASPSPDDAGADETAPTTTAGSTTSPPSTTAATPGSTTTTTPTTTTTLASLTGLAYETVVATMPTPIFATSPPGDGRLFVAAKEGSLWIHDGSALAAEPFIDITDRVRNSGEQGLLGLAFAADYADSGRFFIHYTAGNGDTVLSEFTASGDTADPASEVELFRTGQPAGNHNGGMLAFGPDGHLYLALGDGGGANDRFGHGQRSDTVLGALLRFDVSSPGVATPAAGNPFPAEEVFAYGLRNPWRFDFDPVTGDLYVADVGQGLYEEITVVAGDAVGVNYGWPITEGLHCFSPRSGCDTTGLTLPILEVEHGDAGTCSITGGFVYRGEAIPELDGHYLYSDYCGGYLRSLRVDGGVLAERRDWTDDVGVPGQIVSFGTDADGEVLVLTAGGEVLRIVPVRG